eukprot:8650-Heterococcus_DN1.PRE.2
MSYGAADGSKVYVGNLGWDTTTDSLNSTFSQYGAITDCTVATDRETAYRRHQLQQFGFLPWRCTQHLTAAFCCVDTVTQLTCALCSIGCGCCQLQLLCFRMCLSQPSYLLTACTSAVCTLTELTTVIAYY